MKLSEAFEYKGYWWLPSSPDNEVAGLLKYEPKEQIKLELFGKFGADDESVFDIIDQTDENVIHGKLENGKDVTLLKCHPSVSINFSSFPITSYTCIYCLIGKHYMSLEDVGKYRMAVHFPEMSYWCHPGVLTETLIQNQDKDKQGLRFEFENIVGGNLIQEVELGDGFKILLRGGAGFNSEPGLLNNVITQSTWIEFETETETSFKKMLSHAYKFEEFFSLATLREVEMSEVTFYDDECYQEYKDGRRTYHPVSFISSHWHGKDTQKVEREKFLFDYRSIKDRFADLIRAWYKDKNDMTPIRTNLVNTFEKKRVFGNMDFLIIARALDGYCIRLKISGAEGNRLKKMLDSFSDITRVKKDNICIEELVDSRDYYAHYMPRSRKEHALDGFDLYYLTRKIRRLLICCVLSDLGLSNAEIDTIFKNSYNRYITE